MHRYRTTQQLAADRRQRRLNEARRCRLLRTALPTVSITTGHGRPC